MLHKIPLQDCVLVDTGLNIILAGWKETKNNFVPRLQAVRKVTRQSFGKPEFALIGAQWRALFCKVIHRGRRIHLLYIISLGDFFFLREREKSHLETATLIFYWRPSQLRSHLKDFSETPQSHLCLLFAWTVPWTIIAIFLPPVIPECSVYMLSLLCIPSLGQSPWHRVVTKWMFKE